MELKDSHYQSGDAHQEDSSEQRRGGVQLVLNSSEVAFSKVLVSDARELGSSSGIRAGRFSRLDQFFITKSHPTKFAGVNIAGVIATGGWSSPRMDLLSGDLDTHGVLDIDLIDIRPTHGDFIDGVSNGDSLVEDDHFGMDEEPVAHQGECESPQDGGEKIFALWVEDRLSQEQERATQDHNRRDDSASRSENFRVTHTSIFSWKAAS